MQDTRSQDTGLGEEGCEEEGCGSGTASPAWHGKLDSYGRAFRDAFERIDAMRQRVTRIRTMPVSISTITLTAKLNVDSIAIEDVRLAVELAREMEASFEFNVDTICKSETTRSHAKKRLCTRKFRYQLPLRRNGKSIKLFHNGSVHATGYTSPLEFVDAMMSLCALVRDACGMDVDLVDFDIQLINALFSVTCPSTGLPMSVAPRAFREGMGGTADLDTERHPSVKFQVAEDDGKKLATACVFQTGNVSIMGAKQPGHVAQAFEVAVRALDETNDGVCSTDPNITLRTTTAKQPLVLVDGYPFATHACCECLF